MSQDIILAKLKGATAQQPMGFDKLLEWSGLQRAALEMIVNDLYRSRKIGCAKITRKGKTIEVLWASAARGEPKPFGRQYKSRSRNGDVVTVHGEPE